MLPNDSLVLASTVGSAYVLANTMNIMYNKKRGDPISDLIFNSILGFTFGFSGTVFMKSCLYCLNRKI
jgi:hypothetical protein